jgi:predicted metalloendopeptidase
VAELHLGGTGVFFGFGSAQDLNDSTRVIGEAAQGGLGLPDRDYYLNQDPKSLEILSRYVQHVTRLFSLMGESPSSAAAIAGSIVRLETFLASKSYTIADRGDPSKTHHPIGRAGLKKLAPRLDWDAYFDALGVGALAEMNVDEPEFFAGLDELLGQASKEDLDHYLIWHLLDRSASRMGGEFERESFLFWDSYLNGAKEMKPRWKLCTEAVEGTMGYALAEAYVKTFDGAAIKAKTERMIDQVKTAFTEDLRRLSAGAEAWMDPATYAAALEKVSLMAQKVGAPDKWRSYDGLQLTPSDFLQNDLAVARLEALRDLARIGKPVDKSI